MGATPATGTPAAGTAADRAASFKFLLGTWNCTRTINVAGVPKVATMSETQVVTADGPQWLHAKQTIMQSGQTGSQQDLYLAYNAQHAQWTLITIDARGFSEVETSSSPALNGSTWTVAFPSTVHGSAAFKKTADNGYSSTSSWTSMGGKKLTSTETCSRQ
jgi:hypothetical protein